MALPAIPIVQFADQALNRFQYAVRDAVRKLAVPQVDGVNVKNVALVAATPVVVTHGLNRYPIGWYIQDMTGAGATVFRTAWDKTTITLQASANTTVTVWVW